MSTLVLICAFALIRSPTFLLGTHWSTLFYSVHFGPIQSNSVHLVPIWCYFVHSVHFVLFGPFVSTTVHSNHFGPFLSTTVHFCALTYREKHFWVESNYSRSKFIKKYINIKLVISKILSVEIIDATFLLSHINITF